MLLSENIRTGVIGLAGVIPPTGRWVPSLAPRPIVRIELYNHKNDRTIKKNSAVTKYQYFCWYLCTVEIAKRCLPYFFHRTIILVITPFCRDCTIGHGLRTSKAKIASISWRSSRWCHWRQSRLPVWTRKQFCFHKKEEPWIYCYVFVVVCVVVFKFESDLVSVDFIHFCTALLALVSRWGNLVTITHVMGIWVS